MWLLIEKWSIYKHRKRSAGEYNVCVGSERRSGGGCVCMEESVCAYKVCEAVYQFACVAECLRAVNARKCAIVCTGFI